MVINDAGCFLCTSDQLDWVPWHVLRLVQRYKQHNISLCILEAKSNGILRSNTI